MTEGETINDAIRILVTQPIDRNDRMRVLNRIWEVDMRSTSYKMLENVPQINDDKVYRVSVCLSLAYRSPLVKLLGGA